MKKFMSFIVVCFTLTFVLNLNVIATTYIKVYVYEDLLTLPVQPISKSSNILVPLKNISDALGLKYSWDNKLKKATVKNNKSNISVTVSSKKAYVNGKPKTLDIAPLMAKNVVMIPYKFIPQALGISVKWDSLNSRILIGKSELSSDIHLSYNGTPVDINNLYSVNGTSKYKGYRQLKGYPYESKFLIYFKDSSKGQIVSFETVTVDKANLNQIITWKYNGKTFKNKRADIYNFFSGTSRLSSLVNDGSYSLDWLSKTFGKVYYDWLFYQSVSQDASKIVEKFIDKERGITNTFNTDEIKIIGEPPETEPIDLDGITEYTEGPLDSSNEKPNDSNNQGKQDSNDNYSKFREQWISEDDLSDEYNITTWWNGKTIELTQRITGLKYTVDNSPSSSFESEKIYQSSAGIQFQYIKTIEFDGNSVSLNKIVFDRKALEATLQSKGFKKINH
ncbi:copper amine oxidase N-terminal domain-containing protein [Ruminiclostridium papyrosolvens]|uniref:Copper amine oxidase-like N-terminal domain-containing protein n=1 Tax=Ruminiclostridium papyrosolvens C7 TaxID=1330534 RepID=U4R4U0_9FIRM|nr:copper amine oxidase N-terminal domain-containing protein [Ruminiclostridium papyrosolvens]EPR13582.1 hypothetical protein L323_03820 [Ruminiclostridium papyrosolvens C7]